MYLDKSRTSHLQVSSDPNCMDCALASGRGWRVDDAPWDCSVPQFRGHLLRGCVTLGATCKLYS